MPSLFLQPGLYGGNSNRRTAFPAPSAGLETKPATMPKPPYDMLYIYEMAGDLRPFTGGLAKGFLGLWLEGEMSYLFFERPAEDDAERLVRESGMELLASHRLSYEEWQGGMELEPFEVSGLRIVPAWGREEDLNRPGTLRLDPGLVFGNGLHPTTRNCLGFLAQSAERHPLGRVLDLGCGTGILGLAAMLLGASSVLAVDLNPLCVTTTQNNARLNKLQLAVEEGPAGDFLSQAAEVVLANLHWDAQKDLWLDDKPLSGKRELILSGITRSQVGKLEDLVKARGFAINGRAEAEGTWFTVWAVRKN